MTPTTGTITIISTQIAMAICVFLELVSRLCWDDTPAKAIKEEMAYLSSLQGLVGDQKIIYLAQTLLTALDKEGITDEQVRKFINLPDVQNEFYTTLSQRGIDVDQINEDLVNYVFG